MSHSILQSAPCTALRIASGTGTTSVDHFALPLEKFRVNGLQGILAIKVNEDTSTLRCVAWSRLKHLH